MMRNEAMVVTVPSAYSEGDVTFSVMLQVSSGSWSQPPSALSYQWQRCNSNGRLCTPISGATASSYTAAAADSGHTLLVVVQASLSAGAQQAAALSARTAVVS